MAIAGTIPPGPVTLVRVGGIALDRLWLAEGDALPTRPRADRCRTQLDVRVDPHLVGQLLTHPLGNHVVVVAGHHAATLQTWWDTMLAG